MTHRSICLGLGAIVLTGAFLLSGCLPVAETPRPIGVGNGLQTTYVVVDAQFPAALAAADDGHVYYAEKETGAIRVIRNGTLLDTPFATVPVNFAGDAGLLGIAVHPAFADNHRVYVFYTRADTGLATNDPQAILDNRVVYFNSQDGDTADGVEVFVASLPPGEGEPYQIGGRIAFDAGGKLLVAFGDTTKPEAAQDANYLFGKLLRYNDDGSIPADNPIAGSPIYAAGLREPRGLARDPNTDAFFLTELGAAFSNEINRIAGAGNYGWPDVIGFVDSPDEQSFVDQRPAYEEPLYVTARDLVGAAFNPSTKYGPQSLNEFFFAVGNRGEVRRLELTADRAGAVRSRVFASGFPAPITDLTFTPAGSLYVACRTAVFRIDVAE